MQSDYAYRQTAYLSNNIGARLTGSAQAERAVQYVAEEMRKLGLEVRLQKLTVPHWVRGEETRRTRRICGHGARHDAKIVFTALGGSIATAPEGLTGEIVVVNSFDELKPARTRKSAGKNRSVQLQIRPRNAEFRFRRRGLRASDAVSRRRRDCGGDDSARLACWFARRAARKIVWRTRAACVTTPNVTKIPAAAISFEDAETIAYLAKTGRVRIRLMLTPQTLPDTTSYNVIADLKGSEKPDEIVIVSGHLDSWDLGTGAIDDACGVAVSMQVAYLLKQFKLRPKRTIRVIAWMNEENGLVGGTTYGREEEANVSKHFAAIESDLGASHPLGFYFTGKPEALTYFTPISNVLREQGAGLSQFQAGGVGADIGPLTQKGVPSFAPWFDQRTYFNYHHTAADTLDKVNPKELAEIGSVMAVLAYGLANLEQPLPR